MDVAVNVIDGGCDDFLIVVGRHFSFVGLFIFARGFLDEEGCGATFILITMSIATNITNN